MVAATLVGGSHGVVAFDIAHATLPGVVGRARVERRNRSAALDPLVDALVTHYASTTSSYKAQPCRQSEQSQWIECEVSIPR